MCHISVLKILLFISVVCFLHMVSYLHKRKIVFGATEVSGIVRVERPSPNISARRNRFCCSILRNCEGRTVKTIILFNYC